MRLAVVIPVYNERRTLPRVIERLDEASPPARSDASVAPPARRIILVDDASTDGSTEIVRGLAARPDVLPVYHKRNLGKGAALRSGFAAALADGADVVIIQDGDLEYDPADHGAVLAPILDARADVVIGTRFARGSSVPVGRIVVQASVPALPSAPTLEGQQVQAGSLHHKQGHIRRGANWFITRASNLATGLSLTDIECGTKAFTRAVLERLRLREDRFGIEPELVAKVARMRLPEGGAGGERRARVFEVPVSYAARGYAEGKKIGWRDGVRAVWCVVKYRWVG